MKSQELQSAACTPLRVVGIVRPVTQMGQQIGETDFPDLKNLAFSVLLSTKFIGENFKTIFLGKRMIRPIESSPMVTLGTDCDEIMVTNVSDEIEKRVGCRVGKLTVTPTRTQAQVTVRVPAVWLHTVETHPHLIQSRVAMVCRVICETVSNRPCTIFVANWSNAFITLHKNMLAAQCTPASDASWPKLCEGDWIHITQFNMEANQRSKSLIGNMQWRRKTPLGLKCTGPSRLSSMKRISNGDWSS